MDWQKLIENPDITLVYNQSEQTVGGKYNEPAHPWQKPEKSKEGEAYLVVHIERVELLKLEKPKRKWN